MTCAIIRVLLLSGFCFLDPRNVLGGNPKQMNAGGLMNFFSHTVPKELLAA
jgi:hypothetical protein